MCSVRSSLLEALLLRLRTATAPLEKPLGTAARHLTFDWASSNRSFINFLRRTGRRIPTDVREERGVPSLGFHSPGPSFPAPRRTSADLKPCPDGPALARLASRPMDTCYALPRSAIKIHPFPLFFRPLGKITTEETSAFFTNAMGCSYCLNSSLIIF